MKQHIHLNFPRIRQVEKELPHKQTNRTKKTTHSLESSGRALTSNRKMTGANVLDIGTNA